MAKSQHRPNLFISHGSPAIMTPEEAANYLRLTEDLDATAPATVQAHSGERLQRDPKASKRAFDAMQRAASFPVQDNAQGARRKNPIGGNAVRAPR